MVLPMAIVAPLRETLACCGRYILASVDSVRYPGTGLYLLARYCSRVEGVLYVRAQVESALRGHGDNVGGWIGEWLVTHVPSASNRYTRT